MQILQKLLQQCFEECEKHQVDSIAFPAIGPGGLGYPVQLVAKIMISESCKYLATAKNASFQINLVIFDKTQHKVFQAELESTSSQESMKKKSATTAGKESTKNKLDTSMFFEEATATMPATATTDFTLNGIQISVVKGDITKDSSDAIVNTTSSSINLGNSGQVSMILLKIAGSKLQDLCTAAIKKEGQLTEGKVIHTKALKPLQCNSLFHVYFNSNDPVKYVETINACLVRAEHLQYKTIAFPAIGTGARNYPNAEAARGFLAGIKQFSLTKPQHLKHVRIVIFNEAIYDKFLTAIQPGAVGFSPHQADITEDDFYDVSDTDALLEPDLSHEIDDEDSHYEIVTHTPSLSAPWSSSELASSVDEDSLQEAPQTGLKLLICGFDGTKVCSAVERLTQLLRENFVKEVIDDEIISLLKPAECQDIQRGCKTSGVECRIETDIGRIHLKGNVNDITKIKTKVYSIIHKVMSRKIENFVKEEIDDEIISLLKPAECQCIQRECKTSGVECRIETDIGRIHLKGNVNDITKIKTKVYSIIHKVMSRKIEECDKELQHRFEVEKFYQTTRWQYMSSGSTKFEDYDKDVSYAIEQAYQQCLQDKKKNIFYYKEIAYEFTIDFKKLEEKDHVTKQSRRVRRFTTKQLGKYTSLQVSS